MQIHSMLSHHGKQNWDEPLPLAISYYQLYCDIAAEEANISTSASTTTSGKSDKNEGVTTVTSTPNEQSDDDDDEVPCDLLQSEQEPTANHEQQQQQPWVEDTEWDAVREAAAERELRDNMARCRISSSTTAARSVPNAAPSKAAAAAWDQFYQHHQTSFFKDRHWPAVAFPNEFSAGGVLVEVGCGVGNTLLPLLEKTNNKMSCAADHHNSWTVYGLDLSPAAIELLQRDDRFQQAQSQGRAFAAVADIAQPDTIPQNWLGVATVTSLLFCLSAVDPVHQATAVANALATLRPGGILVLRDYGRYDEAQMKLGRQRHKLLQDNYYRKHDGTCCYYFTIERIRELFLSTSTVTEELECIYIRRVYANRLEQTQRRRVWVQARFRKKDGPD